MGWPDYRRIPVAIPTGATSIDLDPIEWIHRIKSHIPDPGRQCQKFYWAYYNYTRTPVASEERKGTGKPAAGLPDRDDSDCSMQAHSTWARLIEKSFEADLLLCPCGGRVRIVSFNNGSARCRPILCHHESERCQIRDPFEPRLPSSVSEKILQ